MPATVNHRWSYHPVDSEEATRLVSALQVSSVLAELLVRDDFLKPTDFDDAWGRRVDYERLDAQRYRLCSRGPDNLPKTEDDVCLGGRP